MNVLNLIERTNKKHTKVESSGTVISFVIGYWTNDDGLAVGKSGKPIEDFPGELLLKKEYHLLCPYDKTHKGRPCVKLSGENGKHLGTVYHSNEMIRYLLQEVIVPNADAGLCNLLRDLMKYRAGRDDELVVNGLSLVGLYEFKRGLTPLLEKQEKRIKDGGGKFTSKRSKAQSKEARGKEPKQRYHRPPAQDVGLRTLTQDMCC